MSKQHDQLQVNREQQNLDKRSAKLQPADEIQLDNVPRLDEQLLRYHTCGMYQLIFSKSYIQEHIDGESDIHKYQYKPNFLQAQV